MTDIQPVPQPGVYRYRAPQSELDLEEEIRSNRPEEYADYLIWSGSAEGSEFYHGEILLFCGERVPIGKALRRYSQYQAAYGNRHPADLFWVVHTVVNYPERKLLPTWSKNFKRLTRDQVDKELMSRERKIHTDMLDMLREYLETGIARSKYPVI